MRAFFWVFFLRFFGFVGGSRVSGDANALRESRRLFMLCPSSECAHSFAALASFVSLAVSCNWILCVWLTPSRARFACGVRENGFYNMSHIRQFEFN